VFFFLFFFLSDPNMLAIHENVETLIWGRKGLAVHFCPPAILSLGSKTLSECFLFLPVGTV